MVRGGDGDDTIHVSGIGRLYEVNPNGSLDSNTAVVIGLTDSVFHHGGSTITFSIAKTFNEEIVGDPNLIQNGRDPLLAGAAWGKFDILINGKLVTLGPDDLGTSAIISDGSGVDILVTSLPSEFPPDSIYPAIQKLRW